MKFLGLYLSTHAENIAVLLVFVGLIVLRRYGWSMDDLDKCMTIAIALWGTSYANKGNRT